MATPTPAPARMRFACPRWYTLAEIGQIRAEAASQGSPAPASGTRAARHPDGDTPGSPACAS